MDNTTIAAISTPIGSGGIGIIRLTGNRSVSIAASLFQRTKSRETSRPEHREEPFISHRFYHGKIVDPQYRADVDEVLMVVMRAPRSYTREDVVEIHSHSGMVVTGKIFALVLAAGADIAEPGEFTKRAFLNGRIDLPQAEAVVDIINAKTETALSIANRQLAGGLTEKIVSIREALLDVRASLEVSIDFSDDMAGDNQTEIWSSQLQEKVVQEIEKLLSAYEHGHHYRDGIKMAVVGRPNVGKSSLMNQLIQRDRAIVTAVPGTTRDVIEETLHINGLPVVIMDTAGLHEAMGEVEKIGIKKTRQSILEADIVLFLVDGSEPLSSQDLAIFREIEEKKHIIVQNKLDLCSKDRSSALPEGWNESASVKISALTGENIDLLKHTIWKRILGENGLSREVGIVPNLRHKRRLEKCMAACKRAGLAMDEGMPAEIAASDIAVGIDQLDKLLGDQCQPDVLDQIFSRFCIGK